MKVVVHGGKIVGAVLIGETNLEVGLFIWRHLFKFLFSQTQAGFLIGRRLLKI